jgi:threonine/homoserine/homoserine lactone efflux protein
MLPADSLAPLILFAAVSTVTPGGATTLATASGAQFGFRRSVPLMAEIGRAHV